MFVRPPLHPYLFTSYYLQLKRSQSQHFIAALKAPIIIVLAVHDAFEVPWVLSLPQRIIEVVGFATTLSNC